MFHILHLSSQKKRNNEKNCAGWWIFQYLPKKVLFAFQLLCLCCVKISHLIVFWKFTFRGFYGCLCCIISIFGRLFGEFVEVLLLTSLYLKLEKCLLHSLLKRTLKTLLRYPPPPSTPAHRCILRENGENSNYALSGVIQVSKYPSIQISTNFSIFCSKRIFQQTFSKKRKTQIKLAKKNFHKFIHFHSIPFMKC